MKNNVKTRIASLLGIALILAALMFSFTACKNSSNSDDDTPVLDWGKIADYDSTFADRILGTATAALDGTNGRYQETVLGNFIMDAIAEYARYVSGEKVDFALHNGQNLKIFNLEAGELSNAAITALIGEDPLYVSIFTGSQVKDVIQGFVNSDTKTTWKANCAVMVSKELSYIIDTSTNPPTATNIKVNGVDIDESKEYRIAAGNFIGANTQAGRTFLPILPVEKKTNYSTPLNQAVAMYVLVKGTIKPSDYPLGRYTGVVPVIP